MLAMILGVQRSALWRGAALFLSMSLVHLWALPALAADLTAWSPEVRALVETLIQENARTTSRGHPDGSPGGAPGPRPVVVFDFDNTMIKGDIAYGVLLYQAIHGRFGFDPARSPEIMSPVVAKLFEASGDAPAGEAGERLRRQRQYALFARYRELTAEKGKTAALLYLVHLLSGLTVEEVHELTRVSFAWFQTVPTCERSFEPEGLPGKAVTKAYGVRLREPIRAMLKTLRDADFELWVVSASPKWVVDVGAGAYGVPPDHVLGTRTRLDAEGRVTSEVDPPVTYRQGKVDAMASRMLRTTAP